ncbi:MAG: hypothetical protein KKG60_01055 [Nanoarchaeota archaeon]|nr:hypothetical protein [Nanoarchaeota archaeon]
MARQKLRRKEAPKKKKKVAYGIFAPEEFRGRQIGETETDEESKLIGRKINVPLSELTGDPRSQNIKVRFRIIGLKEGKAITETSEYNVLPAYIKRIVRPGKSKIDDSFVLKSSEGIKLQLKPIIITRYKTNNLTKASIRNKTKEYFTKLLETETYPKLVLGIISKNIQRDLSKQLKKVYPVGIVDLRVMKKLG